MYVTPPVATKVVDSPTQIILSPLIEGIGNGFTLTEMEVFALHPLISVAVTVYIVLTVGLTVTEVVFAPLLHV